jgi:hypothetical protein
MAHQELPPAHLAVTAIAIDTNIIVIMKNSPSKNQTV